MIAFDILTGTPSYTVTPVPSRVVIPNGTILFTPDIAKLSVVKEEIRYDLDQNGVKWLTCDIQYNGIGKKDGSYDTNLHVNYQNIIVTDIPIRLYVDRTVEPFNLDGSSKLKFIIDPLLSNEQFILNYVLNAYNPEFGIPIPGLHGVTGSIVVTPGHNYIIEIQNQGVLPAGTYSLDATAKVGTQTKFETASIKIEGLAMLIDFGDGSEFVLVDIGSDVYHQYKKDGFYTITIYVDFGTSVAVFKREIEVKGPLVIADNDWNTWWATDPRQLAPHWLQVSF